VVSQNIGTEAVAIVCSDSALRGFEAEYAAGRALTPDDVLALALRVGV
jgi:hypothetical protein